MSSEQIIDLYKQGLGAPAIAKKLQTTNHFVYKALRQAGIKLRSHKEKSTKASTVLKKAAKTFCD